MTAIRQDALGLAVFVLFYSGVCLSFSMLLVCMLWRYGERTSYVALISMFVTLSTTASIVQQMHYTVDWQTVKDVEYQQARELNNEPAAVAYTVLGPRAQLIPYWIQFYSYNVLVLLILYWTISLFRATWNISWKWRGERTGDKFFFATTVFAFTYPLILIITVNTQAVLRIPLVFLFLNYMNIILCLSTGSTLLVLILVKYVKTRRVTTRHMRRSGWWQPGSDPLVSSLDSGTDAEGSNGNRRRASRYDSALITRFSIAFVLLALFEVTTVTFQITQKNTNGTLASLPGPDYTLRRTIVDLVGFIPGVTASLVAFAVFGTTKSAAQYKRMLLCVPKKLPERYSRYYRHSRRNLRPRTIGRTDSQRRVISSPMIHSPAADSPTNISPLASPANWAQDGTELSVRPPVPPLPATLAGEPGKTGSWPLRSVSIQLQMPPKAQLSENSPTLPARNPS